MHGHVFLDESGDLGWKFDKPYRAGGSSRYLTIAYLICPIQEFHIPKRVVVDVYNKFGFNPRNEIKASDLKTVHKEYICRETVKMLKRKPHFHLGAITVKKEKVLPHIRQDPNVLYNFMMGKSLTEHIQHNHTCKISRDNRTVKVSSGESCIDYLQTLIWFHNEKTTKLTDNPTHSHTDNGVIFIDWITNIVWSKYEDDYDGWCKLLGEEIKESTLFF